MFTKEAGHHGNNPTRRLQHTTERQPKDHQRDTIEAPPTIDNTTTTLLRDYRTTIEAFCFRVLFTMEPGILWDSGAAHGTFDRKSECLIKRDTAAYRTQPPRPPIEAQG